MSNDLMKSIKKNIGKVLSNSTNQQTKTTLSAMTCGICMDEVQCDIEVASQLCGPDCRSIACADCLKTHFNMIIKNGYDGACPPMKCPFHPKNIACFSKWYQLVDETALKLVEKRAHSTLSIQCGSCHCRREMFLQVQRPWTQYPCNAETLADFDTSVIINLLKPLNDVKEGEERCRLLHLSNFQQTRADFLRGELSPSDFLTYLMEHCVNGLTKGDTHGRPCSNLIAVLHSLNGDYEREATLMSAYLKRFPECFTSCCHRSHCYRCQIRDYHRGKTCEEYQASRASVEDVVACPQCGLQLTKGDGCSYVNCVCGKGFDWNTELRKLHASLAKSFFEEFGEEGNNDEASIAKAADMAVLVTYHGGLPTNGVRHNKHHSSNKYSRKKNGIENSLSTVQKQHKQSSLSAVVALPPLESHQEEKNEEEENKKDLAEVLKEEEKARNAAKSENIRLRAVAWSSLNQPPLLPARARLFDSMMSLSYPKVAIPNIASHILLTEASATKDHILSQAWENMNKHKITNFKKECNEAKVRHWEAMHYYGHTSQAKALTSRVTRLRAESIPKISFYQQSNYFEMMEKWISENKLTYSEHNECLNPEHHGGFEVYHGSRSVVVAVDLLDKRSQNKFSYEKLCGDTYELKFSQWVLSNEHLINVERAERFEQFIDHLTKECNSVSISNGGGGGGGGGMNPSILELAVDLSVGCYESFIGHHHQPSRIDETNAKAWLQIHEKERETEHARRWEQAICAAIEPEKEADQNNGHMSGKLQGNGAHQALLESIRAGGGRSSSNASVPKVVMDSHQSLLQAIQQQKKSSLNKVRQQKQNLKNNLLSVAPAVSDPIAATIDLKMSKRPFPRAENGTRFTLAALNRYKNSFSNLHQKQLGHVVIARWIDLALENHQRKVNRLRKNGQNEVVPTQVQHAQNNDDMLDYMNLPQGYVNMIRAQTANQQTSSSSSTSPKKITKKVGDSCTFATSYSSEPSPLTVCSGVSDEGERRAVEYSVDVLVKECDCLGKDAEFYQNYWLKLQSREELIEREKVRRWMAFCDQASSELGGGGGGGGSNEDQIESLLRAAVGKAADIKANDPSQLTLSYSQHQYLRSFLRVKGVPEMINQCFALRFEEYAFQNSMNQFINNHPVLDPAADLAVEIEVQGAISGAGAATTNVKDHLKKYLSVWMTLPNVHFRTKRARIARLVHYSNIDLSSFSVPTTRDIATQNDATQDDASQVNTPSPIQETYAFFVEYSKFTPEKCLQVSFSSFLKLSQNTKDLDKKKGVRFAPTLTDFEEFSFGANISSTASQNLPRRSSQRWGGRRSSLVLPPPAPPPPLAPSSINSPQVIQSDWNCVRCTFLNNLRRSACEMCGHPAPSPPVPPSPIGAASPGMVNNNSGARMSGASMSESSDQWQCAPCTFLNNASRDTCEVCLSVRPRRLQQTLTQPSVNTTQRLISRMSRNHRIHQIRHNVETSTPETDNTALTSTQVHAQNNDNMLDYMNLPEGYVNMIRAGVPPKDVARRMKTDNYNHNSPSQSSPPKPLTLAPPKPPHYQMPLKYKSMLEMGVPREAVMLRMKFDGCGVPPSSNIQEDKIEQELGLLIYPILQLILDAEDGILTNGGTKPYKREIELCAQSFQSLFPLGEGALFRMLRTTHQLKIPSRLKKLENDVKNGLVFDQDENGELGYIDELFNTLKYINLQEAIGLVAKSRLKHFILEKETNSKIIEQYYEAETFAKDNKLIMDRVVMIEYWVKTLFLNQNKPINSPLPINLESWYQEKQNSFKCDACGDVFKLPSLFYAHKMRCGEMGGLFSTSSSARRRRTKSR